MKIENYLKDFKIEKTKTSKRAELIKEIYEIYSSDNQKLWRKKENWKRYVGFLKLNKVKDSKQQQDKFKKSKFFIKEKTVAQFSFFISIVPTEDLHYILSVSKDMNNRGENMGGWLMSNLLNKKNEKIT